MLEVAATTPSNPLVGGRVVDIRLLTNDGAEASGGSPAGRLCQKAPNARYNSRLAGRNPFLYSNPVRDSKAWLGARCKAAANTRNSPMLIRCPDPALWRSADVTAITAPASYKQQELTLSEAANGGRLITWLRAART